MSNTLEAFIQKEDLPHTYLSEIHRWFKPLSSEIASRCGQGKKTFLLGIQGAPGTGKSTLAALLVQRLEEEAHLKVAHLSLDDFYLTRLEREHLSQSLHPLLSTRGVPGTHDISLALHTLRALKNPRPGRNIPLPRFDKANDDRVEKADWPVIQSPVDLVILEGWCLCIPPQEEEKLQLPVNVLESSEDGDGIWRHYVNTCLKRDYPLIFDQIDVLVLLQAPSFEVVYEWRLLQEQKLAEKTITQSKVMSPSQIKRFVQYFERLTRHALRILPSQADIIFELNENHEVIRRKNKPPV